ncbi:hypothetical protein MRX96_024595 [Rhipicephalus microplus]
MRSGNRSPLINPESEGGIGSTWADKVKGSARTDKTPTTRGQSSDNRRLAWADGVRTEPARMPGLTTCSYLSVFSRRCAVSVVSPRKQPFSFLQESLTHFSLFAKSSGKCRRRSQWTSDADMVRNACGLPNWRILAKSSLPRSCQYWTVFRTPRMNARSRSSTSSRNFLPPLSSVSRVMEPVVSLVRNIMLLSTTLYRITFVAMYKTCSGVAPRRSVRRISLLAMANGVERGPMILRGTPMYIVGKASSSAYASMKSASGTRFSPGARCRLCD